MRTLPSRPRLSNNTQKKLQAAALAIARSADQKGTAKQIFKSARQAAWFYPVIQALRSMTGNGDPCMFCDSNESSNVEHYRPLSVFHRHAMTWDNFLWSCGICNSAKGIKFPRNRASRLLNPIDDHAWDYLFIDEFGNLTPLWRDENNDFDQRAKATCDILKLNREALQQRRNSRLKQLRQNALDSLKLYHSGKIDLPNLKKRLETWKSEAFQPDVADYFLSGPGSQQSPFSEILRELGARP